VVKAILLASALLVSTIDNADFKLTLPQGVRASRSAVNFETDSYSLTEQRAASPLITIVVGGGAYDLHGYRGICLSGHQAWRKQGDGSSDVVFGSPGFNAAWVSYTGLTKERTHLAEKIISSIQVKTGKRCR
jgi:hypothetical protein